jgi:serine/threonine protein kinase
LDSFIHRGNECIVFDYHEKDLLKIINNKNLVFDENLIKAVLKQILEGVSFLHERGLLHRDLKPDNILISKEGEIKIADFDLAREYSEEPLSRGVVTIYYRPPEIFYGETKYGFSLDMWSVGCILAEMILREPIFKGRSEFDVMFKIHEVLSYANVFFFNLKKIISGRKLAWLFGIT